MSRSRPIFVADPPEVAVSSPSPGDCFVYTPCLHKLDSGDVLFACDLGGPAVTSLPGYRPFQDSNQRLLSKIFVKLRGTRDYVEAATLPMCHGRFVQGRRALYFVGHANYLAISASLDNGRSWAEPCILFGHEHSENGGASGKGGWHASACNMVTLGDRIFLCMERREGPKIVGWNVTGLVPYVLSVNLCDDLCAQSSWKFSNSIRFNQLFSEPRFPYFGIPFQSAGYRCAKRLFARPDEWRESSPLGWLEGNLVQFQDSSHIWHDPTGRTLHLFLRSNTAGVGYANILKVTLSGNEGGRGVSTLQLNTELVSVPSGEKILFLPFPGGHNKFFLFFDSDSKLFWLASVQPQDSMIKLEFLSDARYGLPNNERHRLVLHFSKNCVDWCFAGIVDIGPSERHARNYPHCIVDNDDLLIGVRAGDANARNCQYTNLALVYRIRQFRALAY